MFPPAYAPTLSFVGLPWKVVPFPQFELQAKWISRALSGRARLPTPEAMLVRFHLLLILLLELLLLLLLLLLLRLVNFFD